ncbi:T9SS type A sorting domain-containing protein [Aquimarina sp. M1]
MKKIILFITVLSFCFLGNAQFNSKAPWMKELNAQKKSSGNDEPLKFQEIVDAFNEYWKDKDYTKKGSGYKPFKRWENFWKDCLNDDGTLMTPQQIWDSGLQKRALQSKMSDDSNWVALGPDDIIDRSFSSANIGRVNVVIVDPVDPSKYYAGTPAGGIWRSENAGLSWVPLSDELPQIGVSAIAIDPMDTNIIYIGTGDDDASDTVSVGLLKSIDGGQTWNTTGLSFTVSSGNNISEVYLDPSDRNKVFVSTSQGFYKSTDGGASFNRTLSANLNDAKLKPGDSDIIYAVSDSRVYKSIDNGDSFSVITNGLPSSSTRLAIDVTPANSNYVYVLSAGANSSFQGLFKSTDSGDSFINPLPVQNVFGAGQAWYDMALAVSDTNEEEVYTGELDIWKSINGGQSFVQVNNWSVRTASYTHADIHFLRFFNGELYCGSDGGVFKSMNGGTTFSDLTEKMQIGQFYKIAVSKSNGKSKKMAGGLQDNGSFGLTTSGAWNVYGGGDGMDAAIDPNNNNKYYGFMQRGENLWISNNGGVTQTARVAQPTNSTGNWITPLVMNKESELYAAYDAIYRLDDTVFAKVSPNFAGSSDSQNRIDQFEIDPSDSDIMFASINETIWKSTDRGVTFSTIEIFSRSVTSINVHSSDSNIVYVTTSGSSGKVYKSVNGGLDFADITGDLPDIPKLVIKHQGSHSENPLFVGTTTGVYRTDDTTPGVWEVFDNNLPNVPVRDLEISVNDANITAATYGRGVWQSEIPVQLAQDDIRLVAINSPGTEINCGSVSPSFTVKNNGVNPISTINIEYVVDGSSSTTSWTGNINSNETTIIDLPELNLDLGEHNISVNASIANDGNAGNDSIDISFNTNSSYDGAQGVNDFENSSDELLTSGGNLWERGVPNGSILNTAASGQNVYATNLDGNYIDSTTSYLISNCYDMTTVGEDPILKFNMAFDIELDWDYINVEYSTDGGAVWNVLGTANDPNWYNSNTAVNPSNCSTCPGAQWTGTDATMKEYSYDLSAFTNETNFVFRFNFVSDQAVNNEGVVIDDVLIEGNLLSIGEFENRPGFSLFPNPSRDVFNIEWKNATSVSYRVTDISGKLISAKNDLNSSENSAQINLSNYAKGMYFLSVTLDGVDQTMKLIRN